MAQPQRQFIIVTPHQSVGPPGTQVPASRLNMTDEQLDAWVDAGHATEVHVRQAPVAEPVTKVTRSSSTTSSGSSKGGDDGKSDG